jgi:hypothetical protein
VRSAARVPDLGDFRRVVAHERQQPDSAVLLQLDRAGGVQSISLPTWSENVAVEGGKLRFLQGGEAPRWWTVDLSNPDTPVVGPATRIADLASAEHVKAFASDGQLALVSTYHRNEVKGGPRFVGRSALYSVPAGARRGAAMPATIWSAACSNGACVGWATPNAEGEDDRLVRMTPDGHDTLSTLSGPSCGAVSWRRGEYWILAIRLADSVELMHVPFARGGPKRTRVKLAQLPFGGAADPRRGGCAKLAHARWRERDGLVVESAGALVFVPVDDEPHVDDALRLGKIEQREWQLAPLADGLVLLDYGIGGGMMHGPPDHTGMHYYHDVWSFDGTADFIAPEQDATTRRNMRILPHSGEHGEMSDGYYPFLLSRPGHVGVLMVGDMEPSEWLPLRGPCERR